MSVINYVTVARQDIIKLTNIDDAQITSIYRLDVTPSVIVIYGSDESYTRACRVALSCVPHGDVNGTYYVDLEMIRKICCKYTCDNIVLYFIESKVVMDIDSDEYIVSCRPVDAGLYDKSKVLIGTVGSLGSIFKLQTPNIGFSVPVNELYRHIDIMASVDQCMDIKLHTNHTNVIEMRCGDYYGHYRYIYDGNVVTTGEFNRSMYDTCFIKNIVKSIMDIDHQSDVTVCCYDNSIMTIDTVVSTTNGFINMIFVIAPRTELKMNVY